MNTSNKETNYCRSQTTECDVPTVWKLAILGQGCPVWWGPSSSPITVCSHWVHMHREGVSLSLSLPFQNNIPIRLKLQICWAWWHRPTYNHSYSGGCARAIANLGLSVLKIHREISKLRNPLMFHSLLQTLSPDEVTWGSRLMNTWERQGSAYTL